MSKTESENKILKKENKKLEKQVEELKVIAAKYESGYIPKPGKDRIVQEVLSPWFSKGQIEVYCNKERKHIKILLNQISVLPCSSEEVAK